MALWQVLKMYDVGDKLLSGIKSMYVDSLICVRVQVSETGMHYIPLAFQCIYGCNDDGKEGSEIPGGGERVKITWYFSPVW